MGQRLPHGTARPGHLTLSGIIDTANSLDQGIDSKLPPTITIRNMVFDLAGIQTGVPNDNFEFCAVAAPVLSVYRLRGNWT